MKALFELTISPSKVDSRAEYVPLHALLRAPARHILVCVHTHAVKPSYQTFLWWIPQNHVLNGHISDYNLLHDPFSSLGFSLSLSVPSFSVSVDVSSSAHSFPVVLGALGWSLFSLHTLFCSYLILFPHAFAYLGLKCLPWIHISLPTGHVYRHLISTNQELNSHAFPFTQPLQPP